MVGQAEACQEVLVAAWRLHPPLERLGINRASLAETSPELGTDPGGRGSRSHLPTAQSPINYQEGFHALHIPEALLGSPVNHSQCTLRREIWAVHNSLLPAVCWAQTFAPALLVYQANALGGLLCLGMGHVNSWQSRVLSLPLLCAVEAKTLLKSSFF